MIWAAEATLSKDDWLSQQSSAHRTETSSYLSYSSWEQQETLIFVDILSVLSIKLTKHKEMAYGHLLCLYLYDLQHAANKHFPTKNGGYSDKNFNFVVICPQNQQERRKVIN